MSGSVAEELVERMRAEGAGVVRESWSRGHHMSAGAGTKATGFRTAKEQYDEEHGAVVPASAFRYPEPGGGATPTALVVRAEISIEDAKRVWNDFLELRDLILSDPACYDEIDGHREMNRTGATRLALPFGLSIAELGIEEGRVELADSTESDYRYRVRVRVSKAARFVDGIGSCRLSEISEKAGDISRREHFALTKAWTRAAKRAIADILGGTGVD